jgi:phage regulator Rha-like protein
MTKDGFLLLVKRYKGNKAGEVKERVISEFNKEQDAILKDDVDEILAMARAILAKRTKAL